MSTPSGNIVLDCRFNNVNNSGCHPNHICIPEHPEDPHHRAKHGAHVLQCLCRRSTTVQIGLTGPSLHQNSRNHVRNLASQPASRQSHSMHHNLTKACCRHICVTNAAMRPEAVNPWNASRPAQLSTDLSQVVDRRKHLSPPSSSQGSSDPGPIEHHQTLVILGFWPAREARISDPPVEHETALAPSELPSLVPQLSCPTTPTQTGDVGQLLHSLVSHFLLKLQE